jgi:DNA-damage-inducible protein D
VRKTIQELGGTLPEDLPAPDKSIKQIQKDTTPNQLDTSKKKAP